MRQIYRIKKPPLQRNYLYLSIISLSCFFHLFNKFFRDLMVTFSPYCIAQNLIAFSFTFTVVKTVPLLELSLKVISSPNQSITSFKIFLLNSKRPLRSHQTSYKYAQSYVLVRYYFNI